MLLLFVITKIVKLVRSFDKYIDLSKVLNKEKEMVDSRPLYAEKHQVLLMPWKLWTVPAQYPPVHLTRK